jgi:hypothetical protein
MSPRGLRTIGSVLLWGALLPGMASCAPPTRSAALSPPRDEAIAALHDHKCGACHTPPERETRTREHLQAAFARHKDRVHLTPVQWAGMTDYLAAPSGATAGQER